MLKLQEITEIRKLFPILNKTINKKPLIYLDNAATTQKPLEVIDAISNYYKNFNSNIERSFHTLGMKSYFEVSRTRNSIKNFINAKDNSEIIFTSGTTESINLIAQSYGSDNLNKGDTMLLSYLEHHSNIVPWQILCKQKKAKLEFIPLLNTGELDLNSYENILKKKKPKIISIIYASNVLGTINDIEYMIKLAHKYGAKIIIDAAQAIPHIKIDVQKLNCDFLAFSAHKMYGPTGVGILYGKKNLLEKMPPYKYGGGMIKEVNIINNEFRESPIKFEAGTVNIANIVAFNNTIEFINKIGLKEIERYESELINYFINELSKIEKIEIIGNPKKRVPLVSFISENMHALDIGMLLDANGIAIRTGDHCAQPLMNALNIDGTIRVSLAIYNTKEELDFFIQTLKKILKNTNGK